jgi:O-antigen/teichoic acid export membrane protein
MMLDDEPQTTTLATRGASVVRGGIWTTAGQVLPQLYTIVGSIVAARVLGADGVGRISFIAFVEATLVLVLSGGLSRSLMRFVGDSLGRGAGGSLRPVGVWALQVEVVAGVAGGIALATVGVLGGRPSAAWQLAGVACAAMTAQSAAGSILLGAQRWRAATLVGLVTGTVGIAVKIAVLVEGGGVTGVFAVDAVSSVVTLVVSAELARRALRGLGPATGSSEELRRAVRRFAWVATAGVVVTFVVWRRTEILFLEHFATDRQVALYSIPFSAISAILLLPMSAAIALAPAVANLHGAGDLGRVRSGFGRSMRLLAVLTLALTALSLVLGPALLRLVYGNEFADSGRLLQIMLLSLPLVGMMYAATGMLLGLGRQWVPITIDAVAGLANLGLDGFLIPRHAAIGAAVANTIAQLLGSLPVLIYADRVLGGIEWRAPRLVRAAAASATGAAAAYAVLALLPDAAGVPLGLLAGTIVIVVAAFALRVLADDDVTWLAGTCASLLPSTFSARLVRRPIWAREGGG